MKPRQALWAALICTAYLVLHLGSQLATHAMTGGHWFGIGVSSGLAMAFLMLLGPLYTPVVLAAHIVSSLLVAPASGWIQYGFPLVKSAGYGLTAWLVRRRLGPAPVPTNRQETIVLILGALIAPLPWAACVTLTLHSLGIDWMSSEAGGFAIRLFGSAVGIYSLVPVAVFYVAPFLHPERRRAPASPARQAENFAQTAALVLAFWLGQVWPPLRAYYGFPLYFVVATWVALTRGLPGASLAICAIYIGNFLTLHWTGPAAQGITAYILFSLALSAVALGLGTAVTLRSQAEAALAASQERLARVHASARLGLWDCDLLANRVTYDRAWAGMLGYRLEDIPAEIGWWEPRLHPDDRESVQRLLKAHFAGDTPFYEAEFRFQTGDGGWKWVYARGSITARDSAGRPLHFAGTQLDLTERKQAEEEAKRLRKTLEEERLETERKMLQAQKLESLGMLAGGIAHDFNNLLTVMLGNASLAQAELAEGSVAAKHVERVRSSATRAAELCKQLLAYAGKGQLTTALTDLNAMVEDTAHLLQVSTGRRCTIEFALAAGLPRVRVDPVQIRQIVMNLVINASDAIGEEEGKIRLTTGLSRADPGRFANRYLSPDLPAGEYVTLEVADTGQGMPPEVMARIFEPFFSTKFAGRGLGLAAALGIVRGHRGALTVESEPGRGSTFRLFLPAEAGPAVDAPAAPAPDAGRAAGKILIVDDEENVRELVRSILASRGFASQAAADGRGALEALRSNPGGFSAILLDLTMPGMSGEETLRELQRMGNRVPIVLMSGFSQKQALDQLAGSQFAGYVAKPFIPAALLEKINAAVGEKRGA